jgi:hypothetical protein
MLLEPVHAPLLGVFRYLLEQLYGFRFETRFRRIVGRNDHLHFHGDYVELGMNPAHSSDPFTRDWHKIYL